MAPYFSPGVVVAEEDIPSELRGGGRRKGSPGFSSRPHANHHAFNWGVEPTKENSHTRTDETRGGEEEGGSREEEEDEEDEEFLLPGGAHAALSGEDSSQDYEQWDFLRDIATTRVGSCIV